MRKISRIILKAGMTLKILLLSDVESPYIWDHFQAEKFKDIELIISCGDLKAEYLSFIVTMIKAPVFYVPGNHNTDYEIRPPYGCDSIDSTIVKYKDIRILGLGGSMKYNGEIPFQFSENEMKRRILKLKPALIKNNGFDILVTHAPAFGLGDGQDLCHKGFECYERLLKKYSPKYFIHGHMHLNYGLKERKMLYGSTTIINAYEYSILDYDTGKLNP